MRSDHLTWIEAQALAEETLREWRARYQPREIRLILRALTRAFHKDKMSEQYEITFQGHRILVVLDHSSAGQILAAAGWELPKIPPGCNTVLFPFTTKGGARALAVNQTGFNRERGDDEREVNGCMVYVLGESLGSEKLDDAVLEGFLRK